MSVLETRNVFYSYTKGNIILSGINAVFETGKLHVIIGRPVQAKQRFCPCWAGWIPRQKGKSCSMEKISRSVDWNITGGSMFL